MQLGVGVAHRYSEMESQRSRGPCSQTIFTAMLSVSNLAESRNLGAWAASSNFALSVNAQQGT